MCEFCHHYDCPPGCPNYQDIEVAKCPYCYTPIAPGEKYAEIEGECYHAECLHDMDIEELLDKFDVCLVTAEENTAF